MTATYLPREHGSVVRCNHDGCTASVTTASCRKAATRSYAASIGWGRGERLATRTVLGTKRFDLCPPHLAEDRALAKQDAKEKAERKAARRKKMFASLAPGKAA